MIYVTDELTLDMISLTRCNHGDLEINSFLIDDYSLKELTENEINSFVLKHKSLSEYLDKSTKYSIGEQANNCSEFLLIDKKEKRIHYIKIIKIECS